MTRTFALSHAIAALRIENRTFEMSKGKSEFMPDFWQRRIDENNRAIALLEDMSSEETKK